MVSLGVFVSGLSKPVTFLWSLVTSWCFGCFLPCVMAEHGTAAFSLSSLVLTSCCLGESFMAFFAFKHVSAALGDRSSGISVDRRHELESSEKLCKLGTEHVVFGSSGALISFSDENESRLFTPMSPPLTEEGFSASSKFGVGFNTVEGSAIFLNVRAWVLPHCIMGNAAFNIQGRTRKYETRA